MRPRTRSSQPGPGAAARRSPPSDHRPRRAGRTRRPGGGGPPPPPGAPPPRAAGPARAADAGPPQDVGEWGPVVQWPVVGIHVALLPNGKVLAYDSIGDNATETYPVQDHTRATIWDPSTGSQTPVDVNTGFNIFCSGLAHLTDGRMFIAGGNKDQQLNGIVKTHVFDFQTDQWSLGPDMAVGRWYPTVTALNNGEMLITSRRADTPEGRTLGGT